MLYRQGDVLIECIAKLPKSVKKAKREKGKIILAHGEVTGHAHAITDKSVSSFVNDNGELFLSVEGDIQIVHEEHSTVNLPQGFYKVTIQREYSPQEIRRVTD